MKGKYLMTPYSIGSYTSPSKAYFKFIALLFIVSSSFLTSLLIIFDNEKPIYYDLLWMLPITYGVACLILFFTTRLMFQRISTALILGIYFMRMVATPFSMYLGDYVTFSGGYYVNAYLNEAIILMTYEMMVVSAFLILIIRNLKNKNAEIMRSDNVFNQKNKFQNKFPFIFKAIIFLLVLYVAIVLLSNPSLIRSNFLFLVGTSDDWKIQQEYASLNGDGSGTLGIFVTLLNTVFWLLQAFIPPILLLKIIQKKATYRYKIFLSILLLILVMLIATETRAHSIECALALLILMCLVYKEKLTRKLPYLMLFVVYIIITGLFLKSGKEFNFEEVSKIFSAYFSGPQNVAVAIGVSSDYDVLNISMIPKDILLKIPYLSVFFQPIFQYSTNDIFNIAYTEVYGRYIGQIIPAIGQGYSYFGFLLSPIIPCLSVWIAVNFEKRARDSSNIVFKYIFYLATIMMCRSTAISNMLSGVNYLFNIFLAISIAYISIKLFLKEKNNTINI